MVQVRFTGNNVICVYSYITKTMCLRKSSIVSERVTNMCVRVRSAHSISRLLFDSCPYNIYYSIIIFIYFFFVFRPRVRVLHKNRACALRRRCILLWRSRLCRETSEITKILNWLHSLDYYKYSFKGNIFTCQQLRHVWYLISNI